MTSRVTKLAKLSTLLGMSLMLLGGAGSASGQDVINENGGFEDAEAGQTSGIAHWQLLFNGGATAEVVQDPDDSDNLVLRVALTDTSVATNPWNIQVRHYADPELQLAEGNEHQMSFRIRAENPTDATVQLDGGTGAQLWGQSISGEEWTTLETGTFVAEAEETRVMAIHLAADTNPNGQVFYIDDLEVVDLDAGSAPLAHSFDSLDDIDSWKNSSSDPGYQLSLSDDAAEGDSSLMLDYDFIADESWGGSVDIASSAETDLYADLSDSTGISLRYKTLEPVTPGTNVNFVVKLRDTTSVDPRPQGDSIERWEATVSEVITDESGEWQEVRVPFEEFAIPSFNQNGGETLELHTIAGWEMQVIVSGDGTGETYTGSVLLDDLGLYEEAAEPPAPDPTPATLFSFEDGALGNWRLVDGDFYGTSGEITDERASDGTYSVRFTVADDMASGALVNDNQEVVPGDTMRYRVWVGQDQLSGIAGIQPFVQYDDFGTYQGNFVSSDDLTGDAWNTLQIVVAEDLETTDRVGIQVDGNADADTPTVYVDQVTINEEPEDEEPPADGPRVTNGSFEATEPGAVTEIEGWSLSGVEDLADFEIVEDPVQDGDRALQVTVNETGDNAWNIEAAAVDIPVTPGTTYEYSVWARTASGEATANFTVGGLESEGFPEYGRVHQATVTSEWQEFTLSFSTAEASQDTVRAPIHFSFSENVGTSIYIDNLQIEDPEAGKRPVIVEAESGEVGAEFETIGDPSADTTSYITITTDFDETTGTADYPGEGRTARYEVTFPESGLYDLYARVRVGAETFNDDSFFYGSGFGDKDPSMADAWTMVNQLAEAGYNDPDTYIEGPGTVGSEVWKWVNLSENQLTGEVPDTFEVSQDDLTRTFEIGARENGLDLDKFAFGHADLYYTPANLNNGEGGVAEVPSDSIPEPTGPPLADTLDKFLGNVYSPTQLEDFEHYWNQVTPENAGKWGSVEGTRDEMNWGNLDAAYDLAKDNGRPFRFHVLVWGNQQPSWISDLPQDEQREEIREWFEAVADRYPDIEYLEVVNEALPGHNPPDGGDGRADYIDALGGSGDTGWDWIITAFEMADEVFPDNTQLMINDYNVLSSMNNAEQYREIIELLQERDLIDGIGMQGHAFSTRSSNFRGEEVLDHLAETGLPLQVTEMDVDGNPSASDDVTEEESDQTQLETMQRVFPTLWEHEAVEGITFWGWKPGLWRTEEEAYLVRSNGEERPALTWLRDYLEEYADTDVNYVDGTPRAFSLSGNYPNPFASSTTIKYDIAEPTKVSVTVFDMLGRQVQTLVSEQQAPGKYTVTFDGGDLASGVYLYRLEAGSYTDVKRMVLVK